MNIEDKVEVRDKNGEILCCPPHYLPHRFFFTKTIDDEPCHYHNAWWRKAHHIPACFASGCPNYKRMMEKYREDKKSRELNFK
jgi:hypothetical protein